MKLNKVEKKGYAYLVKKYGVKEVFRRVINIPDFVVKNIGGFECKKLYSDMIILRKKQFKELKMNKVLILCFDDVNDEPFIIDSVKLKESQENYGGIRIKWV